MAERVVFYQLSRKFVNQEPDIPPESRQVIYYSLMIGHHVGVMDCFQILTEIPLEEYRRWIACLPVGPGRQKLEGLLKWGEIEINRSHTAGLLPALQAALPSMETAQARWSGLLVQCLHAMVAEPALYLMVRKRA